MNKDFVITVLDAVSDANTYENPIRHFLKAPLEKNLINLRTNPNLIEVFVLEKNVPLPWNKQAVPDTQYRTYQFHSDEIKANQDLFDKFHKKTDDTNEDYKTVTVSAHFFHKGTDLMQETYYLLISFE